MSFQPDVGEFRTIFEHSVDAIAVFRGPAHLLVNPAYLKLFGFESPDELIGTPIEERIAPSELRRVQEIAERRIAGEDVPNRYETRGRKRNGDEFDMAMHVSTYMDAGEKHTIVIVRDITEQKRLQEEARKADLLRIELKNEREITILKHRIIATVSHEFRTPLAIIKTANDLLENYYDRLPEGRKRQLHQQIDEQVNHMTGLITDALSFSQSQRSETTYSPTPLHLEPFCRSIFDQVAVGDTNTHVFDFVSHIPDQVVMADPDLLRYAVVNLLTNAVKFSPPHGKISLELDQTDAHIVIRVSDKGVGIPADDLVRVFEPFHRGSNIESVPGTGLGLAVAQSYITLHGGHIVVSSSLGEGSTFKILLPLD